MLLCQLSVRAEPPLSEQRWEAESGRDDGVLWVCRNPALSRRRASALRSPGPSPASAHGVRFCPPVSRPPRTAPPLPLAWPSLLRAVCSDVGGTHGRDCASCLRAPHCHSLCPHQL